ncbi:D-glycerate dehydrogenase [bacterium]|nr:D-glycerate dehydrogenase [bacterium]|tara:strand:- start:10273 stop:11232 length:960 start_codon:yes stop_codon:yes gene_type:complete
MKVVITRKLPGDAEQMIRNASHDVWIHEDDCVIPRDLLLSKVQDADALITLLTDKVDTDLLKNAPNLKIVANYAVGFDNIDVKACCEHDVICTNTPDVLTEATADLTWALMMSCARRIVEGHKMTEKGQYKGWSPSLLIGQDLWEATLGIFGAGRIGRAVAKRAKGFNMKILYTDAFPWEEGENELNARRVDFDDLLAESDFLSLHAPLLESTKKIMNYAAFKKMKKNSILINAARGGLVDEADLYRALVEGEILGAGLDVYDPEPPEKNNPLLSMDQVVLAPHTGSASVNSRNGMAHLAAQNVINVLQGIDPLTPIKV